MISRALILQTAIVALGPLQFGLHMAELNALLPYMDCPSVNGHGKHPPDCIAGSGSGAVPSSIYAVGGLIGSAVAGPIADRFGRKRALVGAGVGFVVGSLLICLASSINWLVAGRFIVGICAGECIVVSPMYVSEMAPPKWRGRLGVVAQIAVNIGISLTQFAGAIWGEYYWRRVLGLGVVVAVLFLVALLWCVESPQWLKYKGRSAEAGETRAFLCPELDVESQDYDESGSRATVPMKEYLLKPIYRASLATAGGIMILQQMSGINAIVFYGVPILQAALPDAAGLVNLMLSLINLGITLVSAALIDGFGRRRLLIISCFGSAVGTALLALGLSAKNSLMACVAAVLVVAFFAIGLGPIPFLIISELTPPQAVGAAQSAGTTFNWIATFAISAFFPPLDRILGPPVFYIFTVFSFVGAIVLGRVLTH